MNYLAHVYLSRENIDLAIGNFIADNIKGNNYKKFNINCQKGILLHCSIAQPFYWQAL